MKVQFAVQTLLITLLTVVSLQAQTTSNERCAGYPADHTLFVENRGQWEGNARFLLRTPGLNTWVTDDGMVYDLYRVEKSVGQSSSATSRDIPHDALMRRGAVVRLRFTSGHPLRVTHGTLQGDGIFNYFIGRDETRWRVGVAGYHGVRTNDLYKGIDVVHYIDEGRPRYDLLVAPAGNPHDVGIAVEGCESVDIGPDGELRITTAIGVIEQRGLRAYQTINGVEQDVACHFVVRDDGNIGFATGEYDRSHALVIDPVVFSTLLGGSMQESSGGLALDSVGSTVISGATLSSDFPTSIGAYSTSKNDIVVSKISPDGTRLLFSTFIGGGDLDYSTGVAVDRGGNVYLTGRTWSSDFATTSNAYSRTSSGDADAFVVKLNAGGNALLYSTYIGGAAMDWGESIAITRYGEAVVSGLTSDGFPTTPGAWKERGNGSRDIFVAKLKADGSGLVFSTLFGSTGDDFGFAAAIGSDGGIYIGGSASAVGFPQTSGAFAGTGDANNPNAFVAKLTPNGDSLIFASLLGPAGSVTSVVTNAGGLWVCGTTSSPSFPTTPEGFDPTFNGGEDPFIVKLDASGGALLYATFLGGNGDEYYPDIAVDDSGQVYLTGRTPSADFPATPGAWDTSLSPGANDAFVTKLSADGSRLLYSTFIGGADDDAGLGVALGSGGNVHILGTTSSPDFPTTPGGYDTLYNGGSDFFTLVFNLNLASSPIERRIIRSSVAIASLGVAPNPATDRADLRFSLGSPGFISVALFSIDGRCRQNSLKELYLEAGMHSIELDLRSLPGGRYLARVGNRSEQIEVPVVVVR